MTPLNYVGKPAKNVDGLDKVTGRARFVGDYHLPGTLTARVLRSPVPHGRIVKLDVSPALKVPGVMAAITAVDYVDRGALGWPVKDAWILADQKVRHVGDPVAAVAAESAEAALAGLKAIVLEIEELPGVFDMADSLNDSAPLVPLEPVKGDGNLIVTQIVRNGNPGLLFEDAPVRLAETYHCAHQEHAYLETEGAFAVPTEDGGVTVYANDQSPFINRDNLVMVLGLPPDRVRVVQAAVGGSFGGKDDIGYQIAAQAARLALKTGRPVRLILSREESMIASYRREAMQYRIELAADEDGTLRAARVNAIADSGGYASMTPLAAWRAAMHAAGAYRYDAVTVDIDVVYTNNSYSGAFRGFGNTESAAVIEQAIDELADRLDRDPIDLRLQNCLRQGDAAMTGNVIDHEVGLAACLEWVRDQSGWVEKRARYASQPADQMKRRGIGVACYFHGSSLGGEGADYATTKIRVNDDYSVTLGSGLTDYGQGSRTVMTLLAAETLGVHPDRIQVLRPDTQTAIESGPTVASRTTMVGGNATHVAAGNLDSTLRYAAASLLGCAPDQIHRHDEQYISPQEDSHIFEEVVDHARQMGLMLSAQGHWRVPVIEWDFDKGTGTPYFCYVFGAHVAEIEVDAGTGEIQVIGLWAAHDGGKIVFPQGAAGQMIGGIAQGIGYGLTEDFRFDQGYPIHTNYDGYLVPTSLDVPEVEFTYIETGFDAGPYGAKNLAEPVMIATAPAIANAFAQAAGRRVRKLPITLEQALLGRDLTPPGSSERVRAALGFEA